MSIKVPKIIGHRGLNLYRIPENTLPGIKAALEKGFQVETDVQRTKDRKKVMYHDDFIPGPNDNKLNGGGFYLPGGKKAVMECTLAEILGAKFDQVKHEAILSKQAGRSIKLNLSETPQITTFDEFLSLIEQYPDAKVHLEIKRPNETATYDDGMEEEVVGEIVDRGLLNKIIIISFNESSLHNTRKVNSDIDIGADVYSYTVRSMKKAKRMIDEIGISYWNPPYKQTTEKLVQRVRQLGLKIAPWPWGENLSKELVRIGKLKKLNLSHIMTNQTEEAKEILNQ